MSSEPTRDPRTDPLRTSVNGALMLIDHQPKPINTAKSMDADQLVKNIASVTLLVRNIVSVVRSKELAALLSYGRR
jgi:hypothetical protein